MSEHMPSHMAALDALRGNLKSVIRGKDRVLEQLLVAS